MQETVIQPLAPAPATSAAPAAAPTESSPAAATDARSREERLRDTRHFLASATAERSVAKGIGLTLLTTAIYLATLIPIFLTHSWWLKTALGYLNGLAIGMMFLVGHDACHMGLTPVGWLNRLLGRFVFLPSLHPYCGWEYSHNGLHHGMTNLKDIDPGYSPMTKAEFDALPRWRQWLERLYRTWLGLALFYLIEIWGKSATFPSPEHRARMRNLRAFRWDRWMVAGYALLIIGLCAGFGAAIRPPGSSAVWAALGHVAVAWLWPFLIWNGTIGFITFQQHTHPEVRWFDNEQEWTFYETQVRGTVHIEFPLLLRLMFHNINEHTAHHINPRVPLYELKTAQDEVRRILTNDVRVLIWRPWMTIDTLRRCKLYDFRNHQWLDFRGRPTSASMKVAAA